MSVIERECQLKLKRNIPQQAKFPVIDMHTHWGKLFGVMENVTNYFDLYETREVMEKMKSYGVKKVVNLDGGVGDEYLRMMDKLRGSESFFINFGQVEVENFEHHDFEHEVYRTVRKHAENGIKGLKFWKVIGLGIKDQRGNYLRPDDQRLQCIWQTAAEFQMPVMFHIGDLNAFFRPANEKNEYIDTFIKHPEWLYSENINYSFLQLMEMQENLLAQNPRTVFIIPHVGSYAENLMQVGRWLDAYPNMYIDYADRLNELGRQPYTARAFFNRYSERILLGTDLLPTDTERYSIYWEFAETYDEYFPYRTKNGVMLGDWNIYGIGLEDEVLKKIYYENAQKLLKIVI